MLWISIYLPELSLQSHARGAIGWLDSVPVVISDGVTSRLHVHAANSSARDAGISLQMTVVAAQASAADLLVVPRQLEKERNALEHVTNWLMQFSPMVCAEPEGASLEVSSTLRLFGGITQLVARIRHGIRELGFLACVGIAPTPLAAWLLAKASRHIEGLRMCRESATLPERLTDIPVALFDWPPEILQSLTEMGLIRVKHLLAQPRAGLRRRLGEQVLHDLDRALGRTGDPREPHQLPETFSCHTELLFDIVDAERLLIPIWMLLNGMEGFMRARGSGANEIVLDLKHNRTFRTSHKFGARHPMRSAGHWFRLIRERITSQPFPEAVVALKLSATHLIPFQPQSKSWLPKPDANCEKWQTLIERVASRLGDSSVFSICEKSDHRPEMAWESCPGHEGVKARKLTFSLEKRPRPLLLLKEPLALATVSGLPQHHGPLTLLAGPERIDTGWWDGYPMARDYYVASNVEREVCWVFRDYRFGKKWYLQGYFS